MNYGKERRIITKAIKNTCKVWLEEYDRIIKAAPEDISRKDFNEIQKYYRNKIADVVLFGMRDDCPELTAKIQLYAASTSWLPPTYRFWAEFAEYTGIQADIVFFLMYRAVTGREITWQEIYTAQRLKSYQNKLLGQYPEKKNDDY